MKKSPLAILIFLIVSLNLQGQEIASLDFVILNNNDTIYGLIDVKSGDKNFKSCVFKDGNIEKEYRPSEIKGYGINIGKYFTSQVVDTSFVEVMIEGELSLYKRGKSYFFQKDSILIEVDTKKIDVETNGKQGYVTDDRWRGKVSFLINDCIKNADERVASVRPGNNNFLQLTRDYNTCKGAEYVEYQKTQSYAKIRVGAIVGLANTSHSLNKFGGYATLPDSYPSSSNFTGGFMLNVSWPRLSKRASLETGLHFTKAKSTESTSRIGVGNAIITNTSTIEYSLTSIPFIGNFAIVNSDIKVFLSAGIGLGFYSGFDTTLKRFIDFDTDTEGPREVANDQAFRPVGSMIEYVGGIGVSKDFKDFTAGVLGRYITAPRLNEELDLTVSQERLSIGVFVLLKGKE